MDNEIRKSGISVIGDVSWGTHFCQFYQTKQDLIDTLVPYFKTGLENNEFCMWVTADNLTVRDALKAMRKAMPGFSAYLKNGQIEILPYNEWYLKNGSFDSQRVLDGWVGKLNQALTKGYEGLRLTGNTFWLEKEHWRSFTDYEEAVNNVIGKYKMIALCTYCLDKCNAAEIVDVIRNHEFALIKQAGKWEIFENSRYKAMKEDLIESEKRFRLALKNSPVTVAAQDKDLHFLWAYNQRTQKPDNVLGKTDFDIFPKEDAERLTALKRKVIKMGKALNEKMWVTSGGKKLYLDLFLEPIRDNAGKITGVEIATVDLTGQKQMEDTLEESEEKYRRLFENSSEGLALCEMVFDKKDKPVDYRFLNINPLFEKFVGLTNEQIAGKSAREILPNVQTKAIETFAKVVAGGKPVHFENYSRDLGKWFDVYAYRTKPGQFGYMVMDITARKQTEAALKESEERFRVLSESSPIIISVTRMADSTILYVNKSYLEVLGYKYEELIGKKAVNVYLDPDERKTMIRQLKKQGFLRNYEVRLKKADGTPFWASTSVRFINYSGEPAIMAASFDITELKQAEQQKIQLTNSIQQEKDRLSALVNSIPDEVWFADVNNNFTLANPSALKEFRVSSANGIDIESMARNLEVLRPDKTPRPVDEAPPLRALKGEVVKNLEEIVRTPGSGEFRYRQVNAAPVKDANGYIIGAVSVVRDITESKRLEEKQAYLAGFPAMNPMQVVELNLTGAVEYSNGSAIKAFPDLLEKGGRHPYLTGLIDMTVKVSTTEKSTFNRDVVVNGRYYEQVVFIVGDGQHIRIYGHDISERKKVEESLKETRRRLEEAQHIAHLGSWEWNVKTGGLHWSKEIYDIYGVNPDSFTTTMEAFTEFIYPDDRELMNTIIDKLITQGQAIELDFRIVRKDKSVRYLHATSAVSSVDEAGKPDVLIGTALDITELKKVEEGIQNNEKRYRLLSDINGLLLTTQEPEQIIHIIADKVMAFLNCDAFFNFIVDESKGKLKLNAYHGIPPAVAKDIEWLDFGAAICGCVARDNSPIVSENVQENGDERAALIRSFGIKAYASYPLHIGDDITGTVSFGTRTRDSFTPEELNLIENVAGQISVAMQRKKFADNLKASEERFYNAFHSSPVALSISSVNDGTFIDVNQSFLNLFGYQREEVIGRRATALNIYNNPDDRNEIIHLLQQKGKAVNIKVTALTKTGSEIKILTSAEKIEFNGQEHIIWTTIDITEREQAEDLLRETSNYLSNLIDYANAPIIVWDPHFRISRFNPAFERLTGYKSQDVIGLGLDILFPEDKKVESMQQIRRTLSGERWEVVEIPILRIDGELRTVLWNSANVYDNEGKQIIATIAQGQDISERKIAEEQLKETSNYLNNLFDYANAPIIVWDPQFRITRFNHAFERLTGISAGEAIGKQLDIVFPVNRKAESMKLINRTMSGERWEVVEIAIQSKDGKEHIVLWNSATLFDEDGKKMVATIAQGQDITERKQAEEEVNKLNETLKYRAAELETSNKELETFAYSVSHDLRAPLRSMQGFSQALLEDYSSVLNDQGKDYLRRIQNSAELMAQLIDDILQLSRLTRSDMHLDNVNLSEMTGMISAELIQSQPKRKVEFVITPGLTAQGDEKLLRVALNNLLENAWKFTSKSELARIEFNATEKDGHKVFFVRDNGVGFDMKYVDKLFSPFQRLHSSNEFPGTGIGLASVQRIVHRHSGQVWAEGKVGEGATFYFTLQ